MVVNCSFSLAVWHSCVGHINTLHVLLKKTKADGQRVPGSCGAFQSSCRWQTFSRFQVHQIIVTVKKMRVSQPTRSVSVGSTDRFRCMILRIGCFSTMFSMSPQLFGDGKTAAEHLYRALTLHGLERSFPTKGNILLLHEPKTADFRHCLKHRCGFN